MDAAARKIVYASFELPAHGHELSPDPRFDGSDGNLEVFGNLLVRAPVDDRQEKARAALWLELVEHGSQRHAVWDTARRVRNRLFPRTDGIQCFVLQREFAPGVLAHLERRVADDRVDPAPGGSACRIEVFRISENLRECVVDDVLGTRSVVHDTVRHRAQLLPLARVDLADGGLRSGGALKQSCFVIKSRLASETAVMARCAGARPCLR